MLPVLSAIFDSYKATFIIATELQNFVPLNLKPIILGIATCVAMIAENMISLLGNI